ncbi:YeeE/YedE [Robbsia andropogonis]|uniref:YeeE/YedE n=1 Tax=Robbsia andropogonis TaxID=28092 RepID=A0A0F5JZY8_9BURK|nr:YeeE/YedE family protein [Robbsia andropogonis]KKB63174.1 YeeE/YedE [Robbsia andropogonis]MCP1117582.1 YeeE/YedE family protein [Robbsia andropogonis]MCP1127048.1 YeeE/YedE family protein [Robbsia andropogonis]
MTINWNDFTPWSALAGGLMIGFATTLLLTFNGKIAGISGIVGGLLKPSRGDNLWRIAFVAGLVISPLVFSCIGPLPQVRVSASNTVIILAGLLVGVGSRYGSGCTSGHGVCGLSRRSPRSMVATAAFMLAGFVTVYIVRHFVR